MNATVRDSLRLADTSVPPLPEDSTIEVLTSDSLYLIADGIGQSDTATSPLPCPTPEDFFPTALSCIPKARDTRLGMKATSLLHSRGTMTG